MHRHRRHHESTPSPRFEFGHPLARIALGSTVTIAVLSAGAYVFCSFSDLSAEQLAAGPRATGAGGAPAAVVLARTGRSWGAAAEQRQAAAAASTPVASIESSDNRRHR